ncbi:hypothetical protein FRC02_010357 [Tulasnella sp. 418]|nr:hypothetical protein FRC02_010357 [Tulasnella sp. 418]
MAPLDLFCSCRSRAKGEKFFDLLAPHSTRWRALVVDYNNNIGLSLDFLAGQSFPLLEFARESPHNTLNPHNLNIVAPSLQVLKAPEHPLCLRLDHDMPSMLTMLSFTASIDSVPFLPADYYTLLSSTPHLRELEIRGFRNADFPDPDVPEPTRIDLPHLKNS